MARPKSEDKRLAIMRAATRVIVTHGLSAPTAMIAKAAGISNGSLFTYFETKTELYNQLYLELKKEMVAAAWREISLDADLRTQMSQVWSNWMEWATAHPDKRRAVAEKSLRHVSSPREIRQPREPPSPRDVTTPAKSKPKRGRPGFPRPQSFGAFASRR